MLDKYGDELVKAGLSKHIPRNSGDGYETMSLSEFVGTMTKKAKVKDDPLYVFDQNTFFQSNPDLLSQVKLPPFFR
jgi:hypothetical protein